MLAIVSQQREPTRFDQVHERFVDDAIFQQTPRDPISRDRLETSAEKNKMCPYVPFRADESIMRDAPQQCMIDSPIPIRDVVGIF